MAIWMSRIALGIVNNSQYYYGLIFCFIMLFTGYAAGLFLAKRHEGMPWESLTLLGVSSFFLNSINLPAKMLILGLVGGLIFYCIVKEYRKYFIGGFIFGGVASFLLGGELFVNYSKMEIFIGLIVFIYSLCRLKEVKFKFLIIILNTILFGFFASTLIQNCNDLKIEKDTHELISNTTLGKVRVKFNENKEVSVFDHRNNLIDYRANYFHNNSLILPVLLQRNAKDLNVLYVGYAPSIMPIGIFTSPLVQKLDVLYWGGLDIGNKQNKLHHRFPGTEILLKYLDENDRYDVIFVEDLPKDDYISQRIFLRYAKKLLKDSQGIIVFPEELIRTYDGRYVKPYADNKLVFLTNAGTEEYGDKLKDRYLNILSLDRANNEELNVLLDEVIPEVFVIPEEIRGGEKVDKWALDLAINPELLKIILIVLIVVYLIVRMFLSRYKDNSYLFYGFENGYSVLIVGLSVIALLAEYRLVYWFFAPALLSLLGFLTISYNSKKFEFVCTLALAWVFAYMLIPELILTLQPFVFLLPFWVLALMAEGNTIKDIGNHTKSMDKNTPRYCTLLGVFVGLILLLLCKNQEVYSYLIYGAMLFRIMYLLKI